MKLKRFVDCKASSPRLPSGILVAETCEKISLYDAILRRDFEFVTADRYPFKISEAIVLRRFQLSHPVTVCSAYIDVWKMQLKIRLFIYY